MISKLSPPELGCKQILRRRYNRVQKSVGLFRSATLPPGGQFAKHGLGHEIDVPAVNEFEIAADQGIVRKKRDLFVLGDRISIHAVLGKRFLNAFLVCVPEQSGRAHQGEGTRGFDGLSPFLKPGFDLARLTEFAARHSRNARVCGAEIKDRSTRFLSFETNLNLS